MSLSGRIFVGLGAGIFTGLFFGELVADLKLVGDVFVKLLQITVLPYIVVSLIAGFGRMHMDQARRLAVRGTAALLVIWALALIIIFVAPLAFPDLDTASFFGSPQAQDVEKPDLYELYLPANIFYSLSNNLVPAVVFFSILVGVALISVEDKSGVLPIFDGLADAMSKINAAIVKLTPYGIFAIAAAAAGTMTVEEVGRVQVYLVTYISLALLVTFWIFPGLVSALSGIPFREVLGTFRDALVTAFATGNQFVVLPQIAENCKQLLRRHNLHSDEAESAVDIIVPVSFNFPSLGKLLVLLFVLFAAWFTDTDLGATERLELAFRMLPVGLCIVDLEGRMQLSNDQMRAYLPSGKVPSTDAENLHRWRGWHADGSVIGPEDFAIARAMRGETVVPGLEFQYLHDDGCARWTRVAAAPLRDAGLLFFGRTNMSEFAYSGIGTNAHYGTPLSIWDRACGRSLFLRLGLSLALNLDSLQRVQATDS